MTCNSRKPVDPADVQLVRDLMQNARDNGYPIDHWDVQVMADDLHAYAADVECWDNGYLVEVVKAARAAEHADEVS